MNTVLKTLLAIVLAIIIFATGFVMGRFSTGGVMLPAGGQSTQTQELKGTSTGDGTSVDASQLSEGQRQLLNAFGVDPNSVEITPEMVACAEAEIGAERVEEIKNGATPSFGEGTKLYGCYRQ